MKILGISAFYHDAAACLTVDGEIIAAAQEERFSRKKHDASFPSSAITYCLEESGLSIDDLDAIAFYDKPFLKFERILESFYATAPRGFLLFLKGIPIWIREKLFLKKLIQDELKKIQPFNRKKLQMLFPEHHLSHAASAFFPSPFNQSAILTIDGAGEWATASIGKGDGNHIEIIRELHFPHSIGLLYSAFTYFLGFKVNSGEYKLMGLAPYGNPGDQQTRDFVDLIKNNLVTIREDGSVWLNQKYFSYTVKAKMISGRKWEQLFGFKMREAESAFTQEHCNLALAIQQVTEEIVLKLVAEACKTTALKNICLAGGVALNCVANGKVLKSDLIDDIFIQAAAGDAGGAIGAALAAEHLYFKSERKVFSGDAMKGALLGPAYDEAQVIQMLGKYKPGYKKYDDFDKLASEVAVLLAEGKVVGWFQGRMEFGPRALGNRSILGDARNSTMQKTLNMKIKKREGFRPFAPAVMKEDAAVFFETEKESPYMLLVADVKNERRRALPEGFYHWDVNQKLNFQRSDIPAVTHVDYSARVQTVDKERNARFYKLLEAFKQKTGYGILVNTSFNVRGEPIVCTPEDAYTCFVNTEMDYCVIGNLLFFKKGQ